MNSSTTATTNHNTSVVTTSSAATVHSNDYPMSTLTNGSSSATASAAKINFSTSSPPSSPDPTSVVNQSASSPAVTSSSAAASSNLSTPKKDFLDAVILKKIREQLRSPGGCDIHALRIESAGETEHLNLLKDRYLLSSSNNPAAALAASKSPASYRHLIDLSSSNLKCLDVYTEENFLCKIINEPFHKVQLAYFNLLQDTDGCSSYIFGHNLIRRVRDIVPLSKNRTYVIIPEGAGEGVENGSQPVYEDLHTYIRNKRRLKESEARALFHQICQTVQVCHRNGIILRDLKLKRFFFVDAERTKLQYESLEGSMILDDQNDDTLSDKIGCPLYTAPELLCPNPTYNGKPADMWSLGVILYTMLVGQYPFYEKNNCNLITIIRHCHVQIPNSLSKSVRFLLRSLLRKNHTERILAEDVFYDSWLKEQKPFYMYCPVDVVFSDDDDMECDAVDSDVDMG